MPLKTLNPNYRRIASSEFNLLIPDVDGPLADYMEVVNPQSATPGNGIYTFLPDGTRVTARSYSGRFVPTD